jgi:integrase/recombinase XerD
MNDPPTPHPTQPPGPPANCDAARVTRPGPVTAGQSPSARGEDVADQDESALVEKVRSLLASGLPWSAVAKAACIPTSVAAVWVGQHGDAIPQARSNGQPLHLPTGEVIVYLEGRRRFLQMGNQRVLLFLLENPGVSLAEMVSRLRLPGSGAGYGAVQRLNRELRNLDPPLADPFRFRVRRGVVERAAPDPTPAAQPQAAPPDAIPLRQAVEKFLAHLTARGCGTNTVQSYRYDLLKYESWAWKADGLTDPLAPTLDQLEAFLRALLERGIAASSRNRLVSCLRSFSRWLVSQGLPGTMANAELLDPAKVEQKVPGQLSVPQIKQLLDAPKPTDRLYHRNRAVLELLYSLGGRASELADLCIEDVDLAQARCVLKGKGGKSRLAFLSPRSLAALQAYLTQARPILANRSRNGPPPWLILTQHGRRLSRQSIFLIVRSYVWRAGLPRNAAHPHAIRHSFGTALLANGANLLEVRDLLGHESAESTKRYTHVSTDDLLAAHARFHPAGDPNTTNQEKAS